MPPPTIVPGLAIICVLAAYPLGGRPFIPYFLIFAAGLMSVALSAIIGLGLSSAIDCVRGKRENWYRRRVEARHPGMRATKLSTGRWFLTERATGKAAGEVVA